VPNVSDFKDLSHVEGKAYCTVKEVLMDLLEGADCFSMVVPVISESSDLMALYKLVFNFFLT